MYSDKKSKRRGPLVLLAALLVAAALSALLFFRDPGRDISENSAAAIRETVERMALECYVVEGIYPPDLAYLEDNYGLHINRKDFYVNYDIFASNQAPTVRVAARR